MPVDALIKFGRRVRYLRIERGFTQEELSTYAGLGRASLSRIENGVAEPGLRTIVDLARALGVKPADLFQGMD